VEDDKNVLWSMKPLWLQFLLDYILFSIMQDLIDEQRIEARRKQLVFCI